MPNHRAGKHEADAVLARREQQIEDARRARIAADKAAKDRQAAIDRAAREHATQAKHLKYSK